MFIKNFLTFFFVVFVCTGVNLANHVEYVLTNDNNQVVYDKYQCGDIQQCARLIYDVQYKPLSYASVKQLPTIKTPCDGY